LGLRDDVSQLFSLDLFSDTVSAAWDRMVHVWSESRKARMGCGRHEISMS